MGMWWVWKLTRKSLEFQTWLFSQPLVNWDNSIHGIDPIKIKQTVICLSFQIQD